MINLREKLQSLATEKYKNFSEKLVFTDYKILGVKLPELRKIAKNFTEEEKVQYLNSSLKNKTFEEIMIYGFVLGSMKVSIVEFLKYFDKFLPFVDNWSICDSCVASFKIIAKNKQIFLPKVEELLSSKNPFFVRVAFVVLLDYYLVDEYLDFIFDKLNSIKLDNYYVKMAQAWLISVCFVKYKNKTLDFLKNNFLDEFTHNKAISKICDSFRVLAEDKVMIKSLKTIKFTNCLTINC